MDTGPVYGVVTESIGPWTPPATCSTGCPGPVPSCCWPPWTASRTACCVQCRSRRGVSYAPKVTVADAEVDWRAPAAAVDRLVRSVTPEPGRGARSAPSGSALARCVR